MLRVIADTNVYVSALHVGGVADDKTEGIAQGRRGVNDAFKNAFVPVGRPRYGQ